MGSPRIIRTGPRNLEFLRRFVNNYRGRGSFGGDDFYLGNTQRRVIVVSCSGKTAIILPLIDFLSL